MLAIIRVIILLQRSAHSGD